MASTNPLNKQTEQFNRLIDWFNNKQSDIPNWSIGFSHTALRIWSVDLRDFLCRLFLRCIYPRNSQYDYEAWFSSSKVVNEMNLLIDFSISVNFWIFYWIKWSLKLVSFLIFRFSLFPSCISITSKIMFVYVTMWFRCRAFAGATIISRYLCFSLHWKSFNQNFSFCRLCCFFCWQFVICCLLTSPKQSNSKQAHSTGMSLAPPTICDALNLCWQFWNSF